MVQRNSFGHHNLPRRWVDPHTGDVYELVKPRWPQYKPLDKYPRTRGFYSKGKGKRRKVIPISARIPKSRPRITLPKIERPSPRSVKAEVSEPRLIKDYTPKFSRRKINRTLSNPIVWRSFMRWAINRLDPDAIDKIDFVAEFRDKTLEITEAQSLFMRKFPGLLKEKEVQPTKTQVRQMEQEKTKEELEIERLVKEATEAGDIVESQEEADRLKQLQKQDNFKTTVINENDLLKLSNEQATTIIEQGALITVGKVLGQSQSERVRYLDRNKRIAEVHIVQRMSGPEHVGDWSVSFSDDQGKRSQFWFTNESEARKAYEQIKDKIIDYDLETFNEILSKKNRDESIYYRHVAFVQKLKESGMRHPDNPFKMVPPDHPYTKAIIDRYQTEIEYDLGRISQQDYWSRVEKLTEGEKQEKQKLMLEGKEPNTLKLADTSRIKIDRPDDRPKDKSLDGAIERSRVQDVDSLPKKD